MLDVPVQCEGTRNGSHRKPFTQEPSMRPTCFRMLADQPIELRAVTQQGSIWRHASPFPPRRPRLRPPLISGRRRPWASTARTAAPAAEPKCRARHSSAVRGNGIGRGRIRARGPRRHSARRSQGALAPAMIRAPPKAVPGHPRHANCRHSPTSSAIPATSAEMHSEALRASARSIRLHLRLAVTQGNAAKRNDSNPSWGQLPALTRPRRRQCLRAPRANDSEA